MTILTNFQRFPERWHSASGLRGRTITRATLWQFLRALPKCDLVIVNGDTNLVFFLSVIWFVFPFLKKPILAHDIILRQPKTKLARLKARIKRILLSRIDHFTLHFRAMDGYQKYFNIAPERASHVPSKPNIRYRYEYRSSPDGEYVLCFGRSERDYDTFFEAMSGLPYPAAIPAPNFEQFRRHASRFTWRISDLPANVRILEDDGSQESLIRIIENSRLVVLPTVASRISASGIGTYLTAMLLSKCVIMSEGPGTSDVLTNELLIVPVEDSVALRDTIRRAWDDDDLRLRTAEAGRQYSEWCGGEPELRQRVLDQALEHCILNRRSHHPIR